MEAEEDLLSLDLLGTECKAQFSQRLKMRGFFAATHALPTAEIVRFLRPYEGAHELAFNLRGDGLSIDPGALEELADIFHPVDAGGFDLNSLKPSGFKLSAIL